MFQLVELYSEKLIPNTKQPWRKIIDCTTLNFSLVFRAMKFAAKAQKGLFEGSCDRQLLLPLNPKNEHIYIFSTYYSATNLHASRICYFGDFNILLVF